jgi:hypothetical protein
MSIHRDFESSSAGRNHLEFGSRVKISELSRQTGGSGLVVSNCAIFDSDIHMVCNVVEVPVKDTNAIRKAPQREKDSGREIRIPSLYGREIDSFRARNPSAGHRDTEPQRTATDSF